MLIPNSRHYIQSTPSRQKGVMLLITLIILVAMTLAAIALVRSVDTTNMIAGNMAFQQTSFDAGDMGTEQAISYMYSPVTNINRACDSVAGTCVQGYKSFHEPQLEPPVAGQTWETYWNAMRNGPGVRPLTGLPAGYSGAFVIEAMCTGNALVGCAGSTTLVTTTTASTTTMPEGINLGCATCTPGQITNTTAGTTTTAVNTIYYRVTTRVEGPRNSVSFIQAQFTL